MRAAMNLKLVRTHFGTEYTVGQLFIGDKFECYTLEDAQREIETRPVAEWKIQDRTAIPRGKYELIVSFSNRFRKPLPLIKNVPGFSGIRIHSGNSSSNTEGCILVGKTWSGGDWIGNSRVAMDALFNKIMDAREKGQFINIEIK
jgi:hypothetical protein